MNQKIEDKMLIKRILKSLGYTILAVFISFWVVFSLFMKINSNHSPEAQDIYLIISFFLITIFIILLCTFVILDKLKNGIFLERQDTTIMNKISFEKFIGKKVAEIKGMQPLFIFEGEESLIVECSWRLRNKKTILVGCAEYDSQETHQKAYEKLSNLLLGQKINDIVITSSVSDLNVKFDNGLFLELFSDSNIYESWTLSDGKDLMIISLPGGKTCICGK